MNLTKTQKQKLREIFRKAQDNLSMVEINWNDWGISDFCCFAIDIAEGNTSGTGESEQTLAYKYFSYLFEEDWFCEAWPFGDTLTNETYEQNQLRRLMALQLCELSLT